MAEIARHAGVNKAAVYYHFRRKEILYRIVFTSSLKRVVNKIYSEIQKSIAQQHEEIVENILDRFWDDNPPILKLLIHELTGGGRELKNAMAGSDLAVRKTLRKLTGIFAILDAADWNNAQVDEKTLIRRAAVIVAASMSRRLADIVTSSIYAEP